jgi:hypothetical protein
MVSHLNSSTKLPVTISNDAPLERHILNLHGYNPSIQLPHTVENKQELYSRQFVERQKEYEMMNAKPTPPLPDINNNIKDEAISNMDELIKLHMQQRDAELKQYSPPPITQPSLENSFKHNINNNIKIATTNENITLMPDVVLNEQEKTKKNVSWSDENENVYKELHKELNDLNTHVLNIENSFYSFQEEMRAFINALMKKNEMQTNAQISNTTTVEDNTKDFLM